MVPLHPKCQMSVTKGWYNLVEYEKSGEFTTNYNSSFNLEVIVDFYEDCQSIELEIKDSSNVVVYDENMYCSQYEYGERTTFNHVANETYSFQSSEFIDIWIDNVQQVGCECQNARMVVRPITRVALDF